MKMARFLAAFSLLAGVVMAPRLVVAQNADDFTLMVSQPAVSQTHVAFVYAGDLWVARL